MGRIICGLQQIGIGVENLEDAWNWYSRIFGMNIKIFEDEAEAPLMTKYTGDKVQKRKAILAMSMDGGGGFEIWQYSSRKPKGPDFEISLADRGIFAVKIKSRNVAGSMGYMKTQDVSILSEIQQDPEGKNHFFIKDPFNNIFQIIESDNWFSNTGHLSQCGGVEGIIVCVGNINNSLLHYMDILQHDEIKYDKEGDFNDLKDLPNGQLAARRVKLSPKQNRTGPFAPLLGNASVELIECKGGHEPHKILENRYWGDLGFIHVCYDVQEMDSLKSYCSEKGIDFSVDSAESFGMGQASGRFAYIEDPDETLIELVETHKVPLIKKIGWYLNLQKRTPGKPLPRWMINCLRFSRVK